MKILPKSKGNPYRVLVWVLYTEINEIAKIGKEVDGHRQALILIGPLARKLRVSNSRLKEYLGKLYTAGFIRNLKFTHGKAWFDVLLPPRGCDTDEDLSPPTTAT